MATLYMYSLYLHLSMFFDMMSLFAAELEKPKIAYQVKL